MSNEPTIEDMDEVIARFMGMKGTRDFIRMNYHRYHCSWDALIPVVLKAKALYLNFDTGEMRDQLEIRYKAIENELCNLSLINTHYCLFKLIQWYNKQNEANNDQAD